MGSDVLTGFLLTPEGQRQAFSDSSSLGGVPTGKRWHLTERGFQQERPQNGGGPPFEAPLWAAATPPCWCRRRLG